MPPSTASCIRIRSRAWAGRSRPGGTALRTTHHLPHRRVRCLHRLPSPAISPGSSAPPRTRRACCSSSPTLAEAELWRSHQLRLAKLRQLPEPLLAGGTGPALIIGGDGWVAHCSGVAVGARIGAPRAGQVLAVPGLGACLPEKRASGGVGRPLGRARTVLLDLDLSGTPVLRMSSGDTGWRRGIARRHAEILARPHSAGPAGLSAEALSRSLFGDADHGRDRAGRGVPAAPAAGRDRRHAAVPPRRRRAARHPLRTNRVNAARVAPLPGALHGSTGAAHPGETATGRR